MLKVTVAGDNSSLWCNVSVMPLQLLEFSLLCTKQSTPASQIHQTAAYLSVTILAVVQLCSADMCSASRQL